LRIGEFVFLDLRKQSRRAFDRACFELRKERDIERVAQEIALGGDLARVDVERIGQRLERYADRKNDVEVDDAEIISGASAIPSFPG
jgi:hypothetical protein